MAYSLWFLFILAQFTTLVSTKAEETTSIASSFTFDSFSTTRNLTLLGDCFIKSSNLGLTRETSVPATSVGRALYVEPIQFYESTTNTSASFNTSFSFSITNSNAMLSGDGLTFVICSDKTTLGSSGKWLGLVNSTKIMDTTAQPPYQFIAIEFDSYLDVSLFDINDNHVGLDLGSLNSIESVDLGTFELNLKSGNVISAWIEYNSTLQVLEVRLSYTGQRPQKPILSTSLYLPEFVQESMYVGFSASTDGSQELHSIYSWSFSSNLQIISLSTQPPSPSPSTYTSPYPSTSYSQQVITLSPLSSRQRQCQGTLCIKSGLLLGLSIGSAFLLSFILLAIMACAYKAWKSYRNANKSNGFVGAIVSGSPRKFTYKELSIATKYFDSSRVIGNGAFGSVYKGVLADSGCVVAVKRSINNNKEGKSEFLAELSIIGRLRHRNLVQLLGWCYEKEEILLVYEYMEQGSLDKLLFDKNSASGVLPWQHRYKIISGVASALVYLHDECEQQVVHRDVKASNIMLDGEFNARLGDFGLAKVTDHNKSPDATLAAGTMGYLAPEYIHTGKASEKTDVFSYGALVLEVACGRRPLEKDVPPNENVLVDWVWGLYRHGKLLEACDKRLQGAYDVKEMERMLLIGLSCSHPDPIARPTMRYVLQILTGEALMPQLPLFKPTPSFALLTLPVSLQDIISEAGHSYRSSCLSDSF